MIKYLFLPAAAVAIASCAPISEDQCRGGDWASIGQSDGQKGRYTSILDKYAETCAEFGIAPVRDTYLAARLQGLQFYCTPQNAYQVGRNGDSLNKVCEPQIQQSMRPAFQKGERYHEISERMDDIDDRIDDLRNELGSIRADTAAPDRDARAAFIRARISDLRHDLFVLDLQKDRYDSYP